MSITMKPKAQRGPLNKKATPKSKEKAQQLVAGPGLPPSMTSQTLPDGIAALDPDCRAAAAQEASLSQAQPPEQVDLGEVKDLRCDWLWRHPINRVPTPAEIRAIRDDLVDTGQLEPIVVWECDKSDDEPFCCYQIISGETRWLAAQELGWPTLQGRIVQHCDERLALQLLAHYNGLRHDLNPMQKAKLIESLCDGTGYTREQAAHAVGLQSGSAASNLVRLLELPQVWQDRVAAGELPESFARLLVPLVKAPKLLKELERDWKEHLEAESGDGASWMGDAFRSRAELEDRLETLTDDYTRPMKEAEFEADEKTLAKLEVIELAITEYEKGKEKSVGQPVATNVDLFDNLQTKAMAEKTKKKASKSADADEKQAAKKKALTPAEQRKKDQERAQQFATRINAWRHRWLCSLVADNLVTYDPAMLAFSSWLMVSGCFHDRELGKAAIEKLGGKVRDSWEPVDDKLWKQLLTHDEKFLDANEPQFEALNAMCRFALEQIDKDPKYLKLADVIDDLARWCEIDLELEWRVIQQQKESNPRYEEFLLLHNGDQLDTLGKELGMFVEGQKTKSAKVESILSAPRTLPMPKSITPLVKAEPKAKAKKKGKVAK